MILRIIVAGQLGSCIRSNNIDLSSFIEEAQYHPESDLTDIRREALFAENCYHDWLKKRLKFKGAFFKSLNDGSCTKLLGQIISNMPNMSSSSICQLSVPGNLDIPQTEELKSRWRMVVRVISATAFNYCQPLQNLNIYRQTHPHIAMATHPLHLACTSPYHLSLLKEMAFCLDVGPKNG